jgi:DNA polymerase III delta prime subunit
MSLDQETINQQEALLHQHRRRLDVLLQQQTRLGDYAPPHLRLEIEDIQAAIQHLKLDLRATGRVVADEPNDSVQPASIVPRSRLTAQEQLNRSRMLDKVETFWVKGVLEQSLYQVARIELGFEHAPAQVSHPWQTVIQQANQLETIPPGKPVVAVFDDLLGELLILGAPGAGKTTTLLELSRDLIARARRDEQHPIPVVLNLSTWATKRQPLKLWLTEELNQRYDVPKKLAQEWVASNPLLLLLDGLDEVATEQRDACVEAIHEYRAAAEGFVPLAVCSRSADYEALKIKLRLQGAVVIQSLTKLQVDTYLKQIGRPLAAVRAALRDDATLWELMDNPLMLSIVALAYKDTSPAKLRASGTLDARRQQLFDDYIAAMFVRPGRSIKAAYTQHRTLLSLAWLARTMVKQKQTLLYIERMQPDWLQRWRRLGFASRVGLLSALVFGLGGALGVGPAGALSGGLSGALSVGLLGGLVSGLIGGLIGGLSSYPAEIQPVETLRWSWSAAGGGRHSSLVVALLFGVVGGLLVGLVGGLRGGLAGGPLSALVVGIIFGLIFGLVGWVLGWLAGEVAEGQVTKRSIVDKPQFRRLMWFIVAGGLGVGLVCELVLGPGVGLLFGPVGGLAGALIFVVATRELSTQTVDRTGIRRAAWTGLASGLVGGLLSGLVGGLVGGLSGGLVFGLLGGLAGTTFGWLAGWLSGGRRAQQAAPQNKVLHRFARNALSGGLGSGLVVGLLGGLGGRLILGLLGGLVVGLLGGLGSGFLSGLIEGISPTRTVTNEGIRRSLRSAVVGGLLSGLIVGLIFGLIFGLVGGLGGGLIFGLIFGLVGGLVGALLYGGTTVLQHYTLRWMLYRSGALPLRLVPFLDYCAERVFLRKVGGGYIFVHRLLMEHFAAMDERP